MSAQLSTKINAGEKAEDIAAAYLMRQGLKLIGRNYSCRFGEIDLIAQDKKMLVFIEVRYRKNGQFGGARDSISFTKQQKIIRTAMFFLEDYFLQFGKTPDCRFDCILLDKLLMTNIEWLQDAFELTNHFET